MAIFSFEKLDSTNLYLKQNFEKYNNFDIILAHAQTGGYGRFKREWIDLGKENIFMSICLKFDKFTDNLLSISQYAALILAETFDKYSVTPIIKWPNDILVNSRKIAGILAESVFENSKFIGIVLGLGINLHANKNDFSAINQSATALDIEYGKKVDKLAFIEDYMNLFEAKYSNFINFGFSFYKHDYVSYLNSIDKVVTITNNENTITGVVKGVSDNGMLLLCIDNIIKEISAGDISFI